MTVVREGAADRAAAPAYDRLDWALAGLIGLAALAAYVRTLAPDLLYGDSAEFQTLAYTLGITHSTGYPVYLLLARGLGFLPLGTQAWRVTLLSAVGGAVAVAGVYLWARRLTEDRIGPLLGSLVLAVSTTFWTQSILAEVYTPALAFIVVAMLLLFHWSAQPMGRPWYLAGAALLLGAGLGVHASVGLFIPPAAAFALWRLWDPALDRRERLRGLRVGLGSGLGGVALFVGTFLLLDAIDPPSSFINTALIPSRSIWGLSREALARPWTRFWVTVTGLQWQTAMFADGWAGMQRALGDYWTRLVTREFTRFTVGFALVGAAAMLRAPRAGHERRRVGSFTLGAYLFVLALLLNYRPGDWHVFLLPAHLLLAVAAGVGMGQALRAVRGFGVGRVAEITLVVVLLVLLLAPAAMPRWDALADGRAHFSEEDYVYPVYNPDEPRSAATLRVALLPDRAMVLLEWRMLYAVTYMAHVEGHRPGLIPIEATPYGSEGRVAASLVTLIEETLAAGIPVYTDQLYEPLGDHFGSRRAIAGTMVQLLP